MKLKIGIDTKEDETLTNLSKAMGGDGTFKLIDKGDNTRAGWPLYEISVDKIFENMGSFELSLYVEPGYEDWRLGVETPSN